MHPTNHITGQIVDAAIEIHRSLGPGLLESAYEEILVVELEQRGLSVERQVAVPFVWKGHSIPLAFRVDLIVERRILVELKSTERAAPVHSRQLLTYLRVLNMRYGLLLNFGNNRMVDGIDRVVNGFAAADDPV